MKTGDLVRGRLDGYTDPQEWEDAVTPLDREWHQGILVILTYELQWIGTIYVLAEDASWLDPKTIEVITERGEPGADTGGWRDEPNDQRIERILQEHGGNGSVVSKGDKPGHPFRGNQYGHGGSHGTPPARQFHTFKANPREMGGRSTHTVEIWDPKHHNTDWAKARPEDREHYAGSSMDPGSRPIGSISWHHQTGEIKGVYVDHAHQRQGIATDLYNKAVDVAANTRGIVKPKHSKYRTTLGDLWVASLSKSDDIEKGDKPGHPFHGNQYGKGHVGGGITADYHGVHTAPSSVYGAPMHALVGGDSPLPDDIYHRPTQMRYYGTGENKSDSESFAAINRTRGKPDAKVTVYRAAPDTVNKINPGDWVTPSKSYAQLHLNGPLNGEGHIVSADATAKELWTNGDSINEWGWHPPKRVRNRKA